MQRSARPGNRSVNRVIRNGLVWAAAATALWAAAAAENDAPRVHLDGKALERAAVEVSRALVVEDPATAREALKRMRESSPPLSPESTEAFGEEVYGADQAFHVTLVRAREFATAGNVAEMFNEYVWVQRACMHCHGLARKRGLLPASGPIRVGD